MEVGFYQEIAEKTHKLVAHTTPSNTMQTATITITIKRLIYNRSFRTQTAMVEVVATGTRPRTKRKRQLPADQTTKPQSKTKRHQLKSTTLFFKSETSL
jgi:hypothetical protein